MGARQGQECAQVFYMGVRFADAEKYLFVDALRAQRHRENGKPAGVFFDNPARQGGDASAAGHHLEHDVGSLDQFVPLGSYSRGREEPGKNVEPVDADRIGDQDFSGWMLGKDVVCIALPDGSPGFKIANTFGQWVSAKSFVRVRIGNPENG